MLPSPAAAVSNSRNAMDGQTRARLYLNQSEISDEIRSGTVRVTQGDVATAIEISALFDKFDTADNVTVRPA